MYIGLSSNKEAVQIPRTDLLTHGVILGRTGSGKSGLTVALLEEIAGAGSSAVVLDPKGDLTNLALSLSSEEEFAQWVDNPAEVRLRHGEGLAKHGLGFEHVEWWRNGVDVTIYTPGQVSAGGRGLNVFPTFDFPGEMGRVSRTRAARAVSSVLSAVGGIDDPFDPAAVFLTEAILGEWANGKGLPLTEWPGVLTKPAEHLRAFGGMGLNDFFPKAKRIKLARTLIGFKHHADRWLSGETLDLRHMAEVAKKPQIAVVSMRHLSEEDRQFFAALLLNKVVEYMFETGSSKELKLAVVLDEARGYLPPHPKNPPTKDPICTILAQGRAQGIGMVIGTQNPMDLDYKALSNVGTWFIGKLRERDCARDLAQELANRNVDKDEVIDLPQRTFLLLDKHGGTQEFRTRWCYNHLFGPLSGEQLQKLAARQSPDPHWPPF